MVRAPAKATDCTVTFGLFLGSDDRLVAAVF